VVPDVVPEVDVSARRVDERVGIEQRLDALFDKIARLSDAELRLLELAWLEADAAQRRQIWKKAQSIVRARDRDELLDGARFRLAAWVNNYLSATSIEYGTLLTARSGFDPSQVRRGAIAPIMDAAVAIVAADELDPAERELLYEPIARLRRLGPLARRT